MSLEIPAAISNIKVLKSFISKDVFSLEIYIKNLFDANFARNLITKVGDYYENYYDTGETSLKKFPQWNFGKELLWISQVDK